MNGRTGYEILSPTRRDAQRAGLVSSTYTPPLGAFGCAPGPTIGMRDDQDGTPGQGDWPLHPMTAYAIEGNVKVPVPEWDGQLVRIKLEQGPLCDGRRVDYRAGRQTRWHVVRQRDAVPASLSGRCRRQAPPRPAGRRQR